MEDMNEPSGDIGSTFRLSLDNPAAAKLIAAQIRDLASC